MNPAHVVPAGNGILFRLLAIGQLALVVSTWPLWTPQTKFPQVPLLAFLTQLPQFCDWVLLGLMLLLLIGVGLGDDLIRRRWMVLLLGAVTLGLICLDQHRLQPWVWQFLILSVVLGTADETTARQAWRWLVIGIYAWSAWSKIDRGFVFEHGPFLLNGLCKSVGLSHGTALWPPMLRSVAAAGIPGFELLVAIGLCWQRTRIAALTGSIVMHMGLLMALGPLGHRHQPGVLIWNLFFIVQNVILFRQTSECERPAVLLDAPQGSRLARVSPGNRVALGFVIAALFWPIGESAGLCDHWTAWAVYAARPERVIVFIAESEVEQLPADLQPYLGQPVLDEGVPLRIDRWSLDATRAPIYPQNRFQVAAVLWLTRCVPELDLRLVIEGPANRWTGRRAIRRYAGRPQIEELAHSFRCGAIPR